MADVADAWARRLDEAQLRAALAGFETRVRQDPSDLDAHLLLARGRFFLADAFLENRKKELIAAHEAGAAAAEAGLFALSPELAAARRRGVAMKEAIRPLGAAQMPLVFWWAQNTIVAANTRGMMATVKHHEAVFRVMERVAELAPDIWYGGPARYFAAVYCAAPAIIGGDLDKGRDYFEESLARAPDFLATHELYARLYAAPRKDQALRERLLARVRSTPVDVLPEVVPEQTVVKRRVTG